MLFPELSVRKGVIRNLASQLFTRLFSNIGVRLLQVPILLQVLGGDAYGRWLLLSTVPAWLTLSHLGFGTVAGNEILISVSSGDEKKANTLYATSWKMALLCSMILIPLVVAATAGLPIEDWVGMGSGKAWEVRASLCCLCLSVVISLFTDIFSMRLRAGRRSDTASYLLGFQLWMELFLIWWWTRDGSEFWRLGLANLVSTITCLVLTVVAGWRLLPNLRLQMRLGSGKDIVRLFRKSMHYQMLPLGHAVILQGQLLVVNGCLGTAAVALFSTARTFVRLASQTTELVNHSVWPELSRLFGKGDISKAARLHRLSVSVAFTAICLICLLLYWTGIPVYTWWTKSILSIDKGLLFCFLVSVPLTALWYTSSIVHLSYNRYESLAYRYLLAASLSLAACYVLSIYWGLKGAAISTLLCDVMMIPFVIATSLQLTHDRLPGILSRIWQDALAVIPSIHSVRRS